MDKPRDDAALAGHATLAFSRAELQDGISRATSWLQTAQHPDGFWCGELEGDTILESEYLLLLAWLGKCDSEVFSRAAEYLRRQQLPSGGWSLFPGGELEISASVKAYFALKIAGDDPRSEPMRLAREAILAAGGADRINSFTRFYLALLGQVPYTVCPAVPPEAVLLPSWAPINIYRVSAWSRTILVPLSIMWAHRPVRQLPENQGISELFLAPPERWPRLRAPGGEKRPWFPWGHLFHGLDACLKLVERWQIRPLRRRALRVATQWMLDRFVDSDGLGAIFPPIVWSVVALRCLGYAEESDEVQECLSQLDELVIDDGETIRLQPCKSPVWDTTITLRALDAAGVPAEDPQVLQAVEWLLAKEVRQRGDWSQRVRVEPAGWFFEHHNRFYPDIDDTIMALLALRRQVESVETLPFQHSSRVITVSRKVDLTSARRRAVDVDRVVAACDRAIKWVLAFQNRDGGWGAFDRDNDAEFLCHVPFADHNAMIDPSTPDIAGRVLEALGAWGMDTTHRAVRRAVAYLRRHQCADGSWPGRWGVNHIYGTWQVLAGLRAVGVESDDPAMQLGAEWLLSRQQASGGWGESPQSYEDPRYIGKGPATASQTAWALLGLIEAGYGNRVAVRDGVAFLLAQQNADGDWQEPEFTGTGFPRVFYLRYHYYRIYFPLLALARFRSNQSAAAAPHW